MLHTDWEDSFAIEEIFPDGGGYSCILSGRNLSGGG